MNLGTLSQNFSNLFTEKFTSQPVGRAGFLIAILTGAMLIFLVQPMFAKIATPLLGGSASVWTLLVVCFQTALLGGYYYAHKLCQLKQLKHQLIIHGTFLMVGAVFLPFTIDPNIVPDAKNPSIWLIGLFLTTLAIPFTAISATAPLVQSWYTKSGQPDADDPYFLYAASNLGSLLALLGYPILIEPLVGVSTQVLVWTVFYFFLALALAYSGIGVLRREGFAFNMIDTKGAEASVIDSDTDAPSLRDKIMWIAFAAIPSSVMIGATSHITTEIASAPFLWLPPLSAYILSFILAFSKQASAADDKARTVLIIACLLAFVTTTPGSILTLIINEDLSNILTRSIIVSIPLNILAVFFAGLFFHKRLSHNRPAAKHLTNFYLMVSLGGVLGSAFNSLLAPVIFSTVVEYPVMLSLCLVVIASQFIGKIQNVLGMMIGFLCVMLSIIAIIYAAEKSERNFYGVVTTADKNFGDERGRILKHGKTNHGVQGLDANGKLTHVPTGYYGPKSGIGQIMTQAPDRAEIGIIGQGAGIVVCHAKPEQNWTLFEIDPNVDRISRDTSKFTAISGCKPDAPTIIGDARLMLKRDESLVFDVLLVDAFSSSSIPVHLLTKEALELYKSRLTDDGILIMHISNDSVSLEYPLGRAVDALGLYGKVGHVSSECYPDCLELFPSSVVAIAKDPSVLAAYNLNGEDWTHSENDGRRIWTDDYSNILGAILYRAFDWY